MRKRTVTVAAVVVLTTLTLAGTAPAPLAGTGQLGSPESTQADSRASAQSAIELLQLQERARRVALCEGLESCIRQLRPAAPPTVTIVESSPFDWRDAGVGAAGTFGLMLLAIGVAIVSRHGHGSRA